eukprot:gb/GECG01012777.1/.p1 GENE.gb/GECG01012777.1/~~gb/GECG01012777.1/.p1  ORF type:complete len:508 (+),score=36.88 gb/GECG01012777.1/:1-1524(+)
MSIPLYRWALFQRTADQHPNATDSMDLRGNRTSLSGVESPVRGEVSPPEKREPSSTCMWLCEDGEDRVAPWDLGRTTHTSLLDTNSNYRLFKTVFCWVHGLFGMFLWRWVLLQERGTRFLASIGWLASTGIAAAGTCSAAAVFSERMQNRPNSERLIRNHKRNRKSNEYAFRELRYVIAAKAVPANSRALRCLALHFSGITWGAMLLLVLVNVLTLPAKAEQRDLRVDEPCIRNVSDFVLIQTCDISWVESGYTLDDFITLTSNETFDGQNYTINFDGIVGYDGLFAIDESVSSFEVAPRIRNVHTSNGTLATGGGFIVRPRQKFFKVNYCSSSGKIGGIDRSGGIVGEEAGGQILVRNCFSTGPIAAELAGGIVGNDVSGLGRIEACFSHGDILGSSAGGICGGNCGKGRYSQVYITRSYSTGTVKGSRSGGIVGIQSGHEWGSVIISQCFTTGDIVCDGAGGITGGAAARNEGEVEIRDSYTTGHVTSSKRTGGISGDDIDRRSL